MAAVNRTKPFAPFETDWGAFAPLKLRARTVAEGVYAGMHRSIRKGAGVEFGGQRPYVYGDDLRFIDKRSLLRHDRMMIREFETETDRALWLVVDATASMAFKGSGPGSKYAYAALLAAALARVALSSGDPVGAVIIGGEGSRPMRASSGREAFDRIVWALSGVKAGGDWSSGDDDVGRALTPIHERARRGSNIVLLSDLVDLPRGTMASFGALGTRGRRVFAVQVLSPDEIDLPFKEHARFKSMEGGIIVDADPAAVREAYRARLDELRQRWSQDLVGRGGALITACTRDSAIAVVRSTLLAVSGVTSDATTGAPAAKSDATTPLRGRG